MLLTIGIVLLVLWLLGFSIHVAGAFINIVLLIALVVIVYDLLARRSSRS